MPEEEHKKNSLLSYIITAAVLAAGILLYLNWDKLNNDKHYVVHFRHVDGLTTAAPVSVNGAVVGKVSAIGLNDSGLVVTLEVDRNVKLPNGSTAKLGSAGIAGGKQVQIKPGLGKTHVPDGGEIIGIDGDKVFSKDGQVGATVRLARSALKTTNSLITDISLLFGAPMKKDIRFQINKLDREANEANETVKKARGTGEKFAPKIAAIDRSTAKLAKDSEEWTAAIADIEESSAELVKSTASIGENMRSLQTSLKKLKPMVDKANDKESALGKLLNDNQAYHTTNKQLQSADTTLKDVMAYPASHWFAIFGKNR